MKKIVSLLLSIIIVFSVFVMPASAASDKQDVGDFVTRLYDICLDRQPDPSGFRDWTEQLEDGTNTGVGCAYGFIFSPEFQNKTISNDDYVELMYNCFFGRASDPAGKADWLSRMNAGMSREELFIGFANSVEFFELCKSYGITAGCHILGKDYQKVAKINLFVERLYNIILGRPCDQSGMIDWSTRLAGMEISGAEAAYGFIFSSEYKNKNKTDRDFVTDLYMGFLGREPDQSGLDSWVALISGGSDDLEIFNGFAGSQEWIGLCSSYGIEAGGNVSGERYARNSVSVDVPGDSTVQEDNNEVVVGPTVVPFTREVTHSYKKIATCDGISFMEASTYESYSGCTYTDLESCSYGTVDSNEYYMGLDLIIYVSGKVNASNFYIKHKGDEGFRDIGGVSTQYIPNASSAKVIAYTQYYEGEEPFSMAYYSDERYQYMLEKGFDKYITVHIEFSEPGLQKFDLYYKGSKIKTIEFNNEQTGPLIYSENAKGILSDILKYKPDMTDLEVLSAAEYWVRNHSYRDYTCWGCHSVAAVMRLRGYTSWTMACSYYENGSLYNDYSNYYSVSYANRNENSAGHRICMVLIDPSHYVFVEVQGQMGLDKGETDFSTPWIPSEASLNSIYTKVGFLRGYDTVYDMVLGDFGVDLKTFDPYDCSTWY